MPVEELVRRASSALTGRRTLRRARSPAAAACSCAGHRGAPSQGTRALRMEAGTATISSTSRTWWCRHRYRPASRRRPRPETTEEDVDSRDRRLVSSPPRPAPPDRRLLSIDVVQVHALGLFDEMTRRRESMMGKCRGEKIEDAHIQFMYICR